MNQGRFLTTLNGASRGAAFFNDVVIHGQIQSHRAVDVQAGRESPGDCGKQMDSGRRASHSQGCRASSRRSIENKSGAGGSDGRDSARTVHPNGTPRHDRGAHGAGQSTQVNHCWRVSAASSRPGQSADSAGASSGLAQLVEHRFPTPAVAGSSPAPAVHLSLLGPDAYPSDVQAKAPGLLFYNVLKAGRRGCVGRAPGFEF